jgi:hypothetical protein
MNGSIPWQITSLDGQQSRLPTVGPWELDRAVAFGRASLLRGMTDLAISRNSGSSCPSFFGALSVESRSIFVIDSHFSSGTASGA